MPDPGNDMTAEFQSRRYSVSEITQIIKQLIEESLPAVKVEGEISNYVRHSSGHRYFTLKDERSQLRCVMFKWQAARLDFEPSDGMKVEVIGEITVYERGGQYQLSARRMLPLGRGDLLARLEDLKRKLSDEGLFDQVRPLPAYPHTVGIATSPTGAAVRDIISIIRRRAPHVQVILRPTLVQGEGAAADIVRAIDDLAAHTDAEVIIVGRGGGSIEDLWSFNEETVARAIYACPVPVVSAVGHETDFTLSDFAADLRAPTPSAAAELVVRDSAEVRMDLDGYTMRLRQRMLSLVDDLTARVNYVQSGLNPARYLEHLAMHEQNVDEMTMRLGHSLMLSLSNRETAFERLKSRLEAMNPRAVLERGYALMTRERDGRLVTGIDMLEAGELVTAELARGNVIARVEELHNGNERYEKQ